MWWSVLYENVEVFSYTPKSFFKETICSSFLVSEPSSILSQIRGSLPILFSTTSRICSKSLAQIFKNRSNVPWISWISKTSSRFNKPSTDSSAKLGWTFIPIKARWSYPRRSLSTEIVNLLITPSEINLQSLICTVAWYSNLLGYFNKWCWGIST